MQFVYSHQLLCNQDRSRSPKKELKTDPSKLTEEDLQADEPLNIPRLIGYGLPWEVKNYLWYWDIGSMTILMRYWDIYI